MNEENPWISVNDDMPPVGQAVRIYTTIRANGSFESHDARKHSGWTCYKENVVTHWQRIVGSKKSTSPIMVEAPGTENMILAEFDPSDGWIYAPNKNIIWWNNRKDHRLWYLHNQEWNRTI